MRSSAGDRFGDIELGLNLLAIGAEPTPWMRQALGVDAPDLAAAGAVTVLPGDPAEAADVLRSRRETLSLSYVKINARPSTPSLRRSPNSAAPESTPEVREGLLEGPVFAYPLVRLAVGCGGFGTFNVLNLPRSVSLMRDLG
ncbi:hypothetical protein [Amycolatopsis alba]|uniref:hypothetical protein n=1 Tax=Amycolatopsis alba TaxID=76020 RepID=UPI00047EA501|nr:hypothetical protein [Amycolatopsis alba]